MTDDLNESEVPDDPVPPTVETIKDSSIDDAPDAPLDDEPEEEETVEEGELDV